MGQITTDAASVYRDYETEGVPATGAHDPEKEAIRALFASVDVAVYAAQAGLATVADIAARDAFFADVENQGKLVYVNNNNGLPDDPENGVYEYVGGSARLAEGFYSGVASVVQPLVDEADAAADAAAQSAATLRSNLWPDTYFRASGGNTIHATGGHFIYSGIYANRYWEADYNHDFGIGAWRYNASSTGIFQGYPVWFDFNAPGQPALIAGDTVSVAAIIEAAAGTVSINARFFGAAGPIDFVSPQINGDQAVVMDGTAKVMKVENMTVPALAVGVHVYLSDVAASTFYTLAFWATPGAVAGDVPPPNVARAESTELSDTGDGRATYAVERSPTWSGLTPVLTASAQSQVTRTNNFTGFGNIFTPAGASWNAIRIPLLQQTASPVPWEEIHVVVRIGASGQADDAAATIVAHGMVEVDPATPVLENTIVPLRDPLTGKLIADVEALLTEAEYGVLVYGRTAKGINASMNQPVGTLTNRIVSRSYYVTVQDAANFGWAALSPDTGIALEHVLLADIAEGFAPSPALRKALDAAAPDTLPELILPPTIYALPGQQANLYFDNIMLESASDYLVNVDGTVGWQFDECWRWSSPVAGDLTLTVALHDKHTREVLVSKVTDLIAPAASAGTGVTVNTMVVGDSLIAGGEPTQMLIDRAAGDVMDIALFGARGTPPNNHEGRGGWTISDYATAGRTFYEFTVSGVVVEPVINSTKYSNSGAVFTVQEVDLTGGAGTLICSRDSGGAPASAGDLTIVSGVGDAIITYSAMQTVPGNPFWIGGGLDFAQYLANQGYPAMDYVLLTPFINGIFGQTSDALCSAYCDTQLALLDNLIANILASDPGTQVGVVLPPPGSALQSSFGVDYGVGQPAWRVRANEAIFCRQAIARYAGSDPRTHIVASNTAIDTLRGYPFGNPVAHSRTTETVRRGASGSGVHPFEPGQEQFVDFWWAWLKAMEA